jgi:HPt (histidine-containing phosphotransfer) domain-containing protein
VPRVESAPDRHRLDAVCSPGADPAWQVSVFSAAPRTSKGTSLAGSLPVGEHESTGKPLYSTLDNGPRFARVLATFVADLPAMAAEIERHAGASDLDRVAKLAHRMKGSAGGYGFPDIMELATALEGDARAGDVVLVARGVESLRTLCARARAGAEEATLS